MMFTNRKEAGNLLAEKLMQYKNTNAVVITIPRGGVPVGFQISEKLNLPLEIVLSKKIGHPFNKEYAIGAVTLKSQILNETAAAEVSKSYIEEETKRVREILMKRSHWYYGGEEPIQLTNKIAIIVDDGIATGNTLISSIALIKLQKPSKIIVGLPVAPGSSLKRIQDLPDVDEVICLYVPRGFQAVGQFYEDFSQVPDADVIELLKKATKNYKVNHKDY